jgi:hypothetical protein
MKATWLLARSLLPALLPTKTAQAEVLRNMNNKGTTAWAFKDTDAVSHFKKMGSADACDDKLIAPLLQCKAPQGSKIKNL